MATWVHCGGCRRAFDAASAARCPACGRGLAAEPPPEQQALEAIAQLGRALARAGAGGRRASARALAARAGGEPWEAAAAGAVRAAIADADADAAIAARGAGVALGPPREAERILWTAVLVAALARGVVQRVRAAFGER